MTELKDSLDRIHGGLSEINQSLLIDRVYKHLENKAPLSKSEVKELQQTLVRLGIDTGKPDGVVGRLTRQGVRDFLEKFASADGQPADVSVRAINRFKVLDIVSDKPQLFSSEMNEALNQNTPLNSNDLKTLQRGLGIKDDGSFGPKTAKAIAEHIISHPASLQQVSPHMLREVMLWGQQSKIASLFNEHPQLAEEWRNEHKDEILVVFEYSDTSLQRSLERSGSKHVRRVQYELLFQSVALGRDELDPKSISGKNTTETQQAVTAYKAIDRDNLFSAEDVQAPSLRATGEFNALLDAGAVFTSEDVTQLPPKVPKAEVDLSDNAPIVAEELLFEQGFDAYQKLISGDYSAETVKAFQTAVEAYDASLTDNSEATIYNVGGVDGVAGPKTVSAMRTYFEQFKDEIPEELKASSTQYFQEYDQVLETLNSLIPRNNSKVSVVQKNLNTLAEITGNDNFFVGEADGVAGPKTNGGLRALRSAYLNDKRFRRVLRQEAFEFGGGLSSPSRGFQTNVNFGDRPFKQGAGNIHVTGIAVEGGWSFKGRTPMFGKQRGREHDGVDIYPYKGGRGQDIAVLGGNEIVAKATEYGGYGISTITFTDRAEIQGHSKYRAVSVFKLYSHMDARSSIKPGQLLEDGAVVGTMGDTYGRKRANGTYRRFAESDPHLHLEYLLRLETKNGIKVVPIDPNILLGKDLAGPVIDITKPEMLDLVLATAHKTRIGNDIRNIPTSRIKEWDAQLENARQRDLLSDISFPSPKLAGEPFSEVASIRYSPLESAFVSGTAIEIPQEMIKIPANVGDAIETALDTHVTNHEPLIRTVL